MINIAVDWTKVIPDFDLTWDQLAHKYDPDCWWAGHPVLTRDMWQRSSSPQIYWKWLVFKLQVLQDELDQDNPYNQGF